MPYKSDKQRRWMHANNPSLAEEWDMKEKKANSPKKQKAKGGKKGKLMAVEIKVRPATKKEKKMVDKMRTHEDLSPAFRKR